MANQTAPPLPTDEQAQNIPAEMRAARQWISPQPSGWRIRCESGGQGDAGDGPAPDRDEIRTAIGLLFEPGSVVEVRIPKTRAKTVSGCFDDHEKLAEAVLNASRKYKQNIYWTANPVDCALLARSYNRLTEYAESTTGDGDILKRRYLLVDVDPDRPAGVSSTDAQQNGAIERVRLIAEEMEADLGKPYLIADSGNGGHLMYRVNLANTDESKRLVEGVLAMLGSQYDRDGLKVDQTVGNAARIWKAYGTVARKGDNIPGQPHRVARVLEVNREAIITPGIFEALRVKLPTPETKSSGERKQGQAFDLEGYLKKHDLKTKPPRPWSGKPGGWVFEFERGCPFSPNHTGAAKFFLSPDGTPGFECHTDGCHGKTIKDVFKQFPPDRSLGTNKRRDEEYQQPHITIEEISAETIASTVMPEMDWCVKNLVPGDGVTVIAGRPKAGKSFFDLQLALAVASGKRFLNRFDTVQGRVLYIALEDSERRIKSRMEMVNAQKAARENLVFSFSTFRFSPQGIEELERKIDASAYKLVIIDPLFATRTGQSGSSRNAVQADYNHAKLIHDIALKHKCGILATHHTKKPVKGDAAGVFDQIQDTTGLQAAIDAMMVLEAAESSGENARRFRLSVTGKDVEAGDALSLLFDPNQLAGWTIEGLAKFTQITDSRQAVLRILKRDRKSTPKKIAIELGKGLSGTRQLLSRMEEGGLIASGGGMYSPIIPDEEQFPLDLALAA